MQSISKGKVNQVTFHSKSLSAVTKILSPELTNQLFQIQFALKKFDIIFFISRIYSVVYGT